MIPRPKDLRSPFKSAIDVSSSPVQAQRFQSVVEGTKRGGLPPIRVQPGLKGRLSLRFSSSE
jgi:hypothetical protein